MKRNRDMYGDFYSRMRLDTLGVPRPVKPKPLKQKRQGIFAVIREIRDLLRELAKR